MSGESENKRAKPTPKKKVESEFSYWLDEQLLHGEASELAATLGVAVSTVTYWRQGRNIPTLDHCRQIAQHLNADPGFVENLVEEARKARQDAGLADGQEEKAQEVQESAGG